jgi:hypothetical protein
LVRVYRRRWAPFFDHCICCFLAKRRLTKWLTVDSAKAVEIAAKFTAGKAVKDALNDR